MAADIAKCIGKNCKVKKINMKTPVDYIDSVLIELIEKFNSKEYQVACNTLINFRNIIIEQAKEMEKQQIMKAVYDSMGTNLDPNMGRAELYYNETYKPE